MSNTLEPGYSQEQVEEMLNTQRLLVLKEIREELWVFLFCGGCERNRNMIDDKIKDAKAGKERQR